MAILLKIFGKKVDYFSCDFDIFDGSIGCATKFHADKISFFFFLYLSDQSYSVFCEKFAKVTYYL